MLKQLQAISGKDMSSAGFAARAQSAADKHTGSSQSAGGHVSQELGQAGSGGKNGAQSGNSGEKQK